MKREFLDATAVLIAFVVGAGVLGLPYVFSKAGFLTGVANILLVGLGMLILYLMVGEISLRTEKSHQLVGYAAKYLGNNGKRMMDILILTWWYSALVAYIIKIGEFVSVLIDPIIYINPLYCSIIFAILMSSLIYSGMKIIERSEFWIIICIIAILVLIGIFCINHMDPTNLTKFSLKDFFFPFGVVIFAFGGVGAIPEVREELKNNKHLVKYAIITGIFVSMLIYILFPLFTIGITGAETTDGAIIGLGNALGFKMLLFGTLLGILALISSFLAVGLAIKEIFHFDYHQSNFRSASLTCIIPFFISLIVIFSGIENAFFKVINFTGSFIFPAIFLILILIFWKAKKQGDRAPEYSLSFSKLLGVLVTLLFLAAFVNSIYGMIV